MTAKLVWATPDADEQIAYCARVSNPQNQKNPSIRQLLQYCARNDHWSVFEMASACVEITTTRDIARQMLRHRSFSFQEFSQRYALTKHLPEEQPREARMQDTKNRQNSLPCDSVELADWWREAQVVSAECARVFYDQAINLGIAKEVARSILPEGLTPSRLYMAGTMRSWVHYLKVRTHKSTQLEHRVIANQVLEVLRPVAPIVIGAFFDEET